MGRASAVFIAQRLVGQRALSSCLCDDQPPHPLRPPLDPSLAPRAQAYGYALPNAANLRVVDAFVVKCGRGGARGLAGTRERGGVGRSQRGLVSAVTQAAVFAFTR